MHADVFISIPGNLPVPHSARQKPPHGLIAATVSAPVFQYLNLMSAAGQVDVVSLPGMINRIQALANQAGPVTSSVQTLSLDPMDNQRLAFHLGNGWSGEHSSSA